MARYQPDVLKEYLTRPTARAHWWQTPSNHVLGGRDLHRSVQGTWLGISRQGRIAILTNFREEGSSEPIEGLRSRGEIPIAFLTVPPDSDENLEKFAHRLIEVDGVQGVGGFSLAFGLLRRRKAEESEGMQHGNIALISNRTPNVKGVKYSHPETWGLSNSIYGDRAWPKVVDGERLLGEAVKESVLGCEAEDQFLDRCFEILSTDTLPQRTPGVEWPVFVRELRNSIFIPALGTDEAEDSKKKDGEMPTDEIAAAEAKKPINKATSGKYGTQKQTVILVDHKGKVKFVERTLYDENARPMKVGERDQKFEFDIEGWD